MDPNGTMKSTKGTDCDLSFGGKSMEILSENSGEVVACHCYGSDFRISTALQPLSVSDMPIVKPNSLEPHLALPIFCHLHMLGLDCISFGWWLCFLSRHGLQNVLEKIAVGPLHAFSGFLRYELLKLFTKGLKFIEFLEAGWFSIPRHEEKRATEPIFLVAFDQRLHEGLSEWWPPQAHPVVLYLHLAVVNVPKTGPNTRRPWILQVLGVLPLAPHLFHHLREAREGQAWPLPGSNGRIDA